MSSSGSFSFNSVRVHRSPSARCASRHRFLRWRRTRPPFAVSGEFRRHRRLSLDLPASLETQSWRPREVCLLLPNPQTARPGRSRCSASRLQFPSLVALVRRRCRLLSSVCRTAVLHGLRPSGKPPVCEPLPVWPGCDFLSVSRARKPAPVPRSPPSLFTAGSSSQRAVGCRHALRAR